MYDASICLGGFAALDAYLKEEQAGLQARLQAMQANPTRPIDDTQNRYIWTTCHMNIRHELDRMTREGWSVTECVEVGGTHVYLRLDTSV